MQILYLTNLEINTTSDLMDRYIYQDLMRELLKRNVKLTVVSQTKNKTKLLKENNLVLLTVNVKPNTKIKSFLKKGFNALLQKIVFEKAIKKYIKLKNYDLVLYYSPPFIFNGIIKHMKKKYNTKTYLMLKDIFPQNSIDLGILKDNGILKYIYTFYRTQEQNLYYLSDYIGCMSEANRKYIINNNKGIKKIADKLEVNPNSIELQNHSILNINQINKIKNELNIPLHKKIFLYGGNLGKPQGIDFLIEILKRTKERRDMLFIIVGSGTEYEKIRNYHKINSNFMLLKNIPSEEYKKYLLISDVGLIFLDYRFTIPNFPSRLLSYMEYSKPIFMASDTATDLKDIILNNNLGFWVPSNNVEVYIETIEKIIKDENLTKYGNNSRRYLEKHYNVEYSANLILNKVSIAKNTLKKKIN